MPAGRTDGVAEHDETTELADANDAVLGPAAAREAALAVNVTLPDEACLFKASYPQT